MCSWIRVSVLSALLAAVLAPPVVRAQEDAPRKDAPKKGQVEQLLEALRKLPPKAFAERIAQLEQLAKRELERAAELRQRAAKLASEADQLEKSASARSADIDAVKKLQAMFAPKPAAGAEPPAKGGDGPKPAAAKPEGKKPADGSERAVALVNFDDHLESIFDEHCTTCHDPADASGGLDLTRYSGVVQGGGSGKTLVPGEPQQSRLYLLVAHLDTPTMPKDEGKIPAAQIETIRRWIEQGAPENAAAAAELAKRRAAERAKAAQAAAAAQPPPARRAFMPRDLPRIDKVIPPRPPAARAVAASPTAPLLAAPGQGQVLLLDAATFADLGVLPFEFGRIEVLRFSGDGSRLLAAGGLPGRTGGAVLYDVETGAIAGTFGRARDSVLASAVSPDGELVAVGGAARRVDVFAVAGGERRCRIEHDEWVLSVDFSPDGRLLASADRGGAVRVSEARTGRDVYALTGHAGAVHAVRFRPDGAMLASAGEDRTIRGWRLRDGRAVWSKRDGGAVFALAWLDGARIATAGELARPRIWRVDRDENAALPPIDDWIYGLASADGGKVLFSADWRGRLTAYSVAKRTILARLQPLGGETVRGETDS